MLSTLPTPEDKNIQRIVESIRQLSQGRSNATGTFTLTAGATSTTVSQPYCASSSYVFFTPRTANAAAAVGTTYVSSVSNASFTVTHANNAQTDRTFGYIAIG